MTDRAITFSGPMVRALLAGTKTQTRRILKPQPTAYPDGPSFSWGKYVGLWPDDWFGYGGKIDGALRYQPGDRLWVREAWRTWKDFDRIKPSYLTQHCPPSPIFYEVDRDNCDRHGKYRHARFMPRWASRLSLTVTDVRVERLQTISEADAIAEGIERVDYEGTFGWKSYETCPDGTPHPHAVVPNQSPVTSYRELWNSIHGAGAWEANPWVVAISFKRETEK